FNKGLYNERRNRYFGLNEVRIDSDLVIQFLGEAQLFEFEVETDVLDFLVKRRMIRGKQLQVQANQLREFCQVAQRLFLIVLQNECMYGVDRIVQEVRIEQVPQCLVFEIKTFVFFKQHLVFVAGV